MKNKTLAVVAVGAVLSGGVLLGALNASAYRGDANVKGPNYSPERHEAMMKAFETKDFTAWKNLMQGRGRAGEVVNSANFAKFAEAHKLMLQGKNTEAKMIRAELGLGQRDGSGFGGHRGMGGRGFRK